MGDFIGWIVVGIAAGWLAGVITRTNRSIWGDLVLGLLGAIVGGFITDASMGDNLIVSIIIAAVVAAGLVFLKNMITGRG
jgi:uncharacterized membrane protein YeaQ/YmgE (transglycosylase-associated protein family)